MSALSLVQKSFAHVWWWLRQVTGDAAYDSYLRSAGARGSSHRRDDHSNNLTVSTGPGMLLSRQDFYLDSLRRKYSGVSRCC